MASCFIIPVSKFLIELNVSLLACWYKCNNGLSNDIRFLSLQKSAQMQLPRTKRKLPSKLRHVNCKMPTVDPKLYAVLKEISPSGIVAYLF